MYTNVGSKIKKYAEIVFGIGVLAAFIAFLVIWIIMNKAGNGTAGFFIGIVVGGILFFNAWISNLLFAGFGVLVESSESQVALLESQKDILEKAMDNRCSAVLHDTEKEIATNKTSEEKTEGAAPDPLPDKPVKKDARFCGNCAQRLEEDDEYCPLCGKKV